MAWAQRTGVLHVFNQEYRRRRLEAQRRGERFILIRKFTMPNSAIALSALEYSQNSSIAEQFNEMTNSHYLSNACSDNSRI